MKTITIVAVTGVALLLAACATTTAEPQPQRCYRTTNSGKVPYRVPVPCKPDRQAAGPQTGQPVVQES